MNRKEIKKWLIDQDLKVTDIARAARVSHTYASLTIKGEKRSKAVVAVLRDKGCPEEFLGGANAD